MRQSLLAWVLGVGLALPVVAAPAGATLIELTLVGEVSSAPGGGANPGDPVELEIRISDDFINRAALQGGRYFDAQARLALTVNGEAIAVDGVWVVAQTLLVDPEDPTGPPPWPRAIDQRRVLVIHERPRCERRLTHRYKTGWHR